MQENVKCHSCGSYENPYMTDGKKRSDFVLICKCCGSTVRIVHGKRSVYQGKFEYIPRKDCDID